MTVGYTDFARGFGSSRRQDFQISHGAKARNPAPSKTERIKVAQAAGYAARNAGMSEIACPHPVADAAAYAAWRMGWAQADRERLQRLVDHEDPCHVPGVWLNATTPYPAAIKAYRPPDRGKSKVALQYKGFRSKSGWKPGGSGKVAGTRSLKV